MCSDNTPVTKIVSIIVIYNSKSLVFHNIMAEVVIWQPVCKIEPELCSEKVGWNAFRGSMLPQFTPFCLLSLAASFMCITYDV